MYDKTTPRSDLQAITLADVQSRSCEYVWRPFVPKGVLTTIFGRGGSGKTSLAVELMAAITTGRALSGMDGHEPGRVVYIGNEDDSGIIRAKVEAASGDPAGVHLLHDPFYGWPDLDLLGRREAVEALEVLVKESGPFKAVIIDPITAHFGTNNAWSTTLVRHALKPLIGMAERHGFALLVIGHPSKRTVYRAEDALSDSKAFADASRSLLLTGENPVQPGQRVVKQIKHSYGQPGCTLGFSLEPAPENPKHVRVNWTGPVHVFELDLLSGPKPLSAAVQAVVDAINTRCSAGEEPYSVSELAEALHKNKATISEHLRKAAHLVEDRGGGPGRPSRLVPVGWPEGD